MILPLNLGWKLATGGSWLITAVLGFMLMMAHIQTRELQKQVDTLEARINDPKTGYAIRLSQSRTNAATVTDQLRQQNLKLQTQSDEGAARMKTLSEKLSRAEAESIQSKRRIDTIMSKPSGGTSCARVEDIDHRFLGMLHAQ